MINDRKLKLLNKRIANTIKVFTNAINKLEKTNQQYLELRDSVDLERNKLTILANDIDHSIETNNKLLNNFKTLLK